jgi:hypothetical protein
LREEGKHRESEVYIYVYIALHRLSIRYGDDNVDDGSDSTLSASCRSVSSLLVSSSGVMARFTVIDCD